MGQLTRNAARLSPRLYERLLRGLPRRFRGEFASLMAQHFADDVWSLGQDPPPSGLVSLWVRTLGDLARTVIVEWRAEVSRVLRSEDPADRYNALVQAHVAELAFATLALTASFIASTFGAVTFATTVALSTATATALASWVDQRWRARLALTR